MKITRVFPMIELGGSQLGTLRLAAAMRPLGVHTRFLAGCATPEALAAYRQAGFEVECYAASWDWGMTGPWTDEYAQWLSSRLEGSDVVHAHHGAAWWQVCQVIDERTPLVVTEHSVPPYSDVLIEQMRASAARIDRYLTVGPGVRALARRTGIDPAITCDGFSPVAGIDARPLAGLPRRRVVFAGRLVHWKGADVLLDALALMPDPPATYILGTGPQETTLREQAVTLGLADTVRFCGWQDEPERYLAGAAVCAVPSVREAWGQTAVQAMAHRVPVVGCAGEGLPETLGFGTRGLLVAVGDADGLARAIGAVLEGSVTVDLDGAERYARTFTPSARAEWMLGVYRDVLDQTPRAVSAAVGAGAR